MLMDFGFFGNMLIWFYITVVPAVMLLIVALIVAKTIVANRIAHKKKEPTLGKVIKVVLIVWACLWITSPIYGGIIDDVISSIEAARKDAIDRPNDAACERKFGSGVKAQGEICYKGSTIYGGGWR